MESAWKDIQVVIQQRRAALDAARIAWIAAHGRLEGELSVLHARLRDRVGLYFLKPSVRRKRRKDDDGAEAGVGDARGAGAPSATADAEFPGATSAATDAGGRAQLPAAATAGSGALLTRDAAPTDPAATVVAAA